MLDVILHNLRTVNCFQNFKGMTMANYKAPGGKGETDGVGHDQVHSWMLMTSWFKLDWTYYMSIYQIFFKCLVREWEILNILPSVPNKSFPFFLAIGLSIFYYCKWSHRARKHGVGEMNESCSPTINAIKWPGYPQNGVKYPDGCSR